MDARWCGLPPRVRRGLVVLVGFVAAWAALWAWADTSRAVPPGLSADFSFQPLVPVVGQTVTFTAVATPENGAAVGSYRWDLDGDDKYELNTGPVPLATATYDSPGTITVKFEFRDTWNNRVKRSKALTVDTSSPVASFIVAPAAPLVNQPVLFISSSSDPDGVIADQAWDLNGDGTYDNGGGVSATRTFSAPGQYVVGLRVTDDDGHTSFASQTVPVAAAPVLPFTPGALPHGSLRMLSPFPVVRIAGSLTGRGARLRKVEVGAPTGSTVHVGCRGRSCPYRTRTSVVSKLIGSIRLARLERRLRAGVRIKIYVTSPGTIGKYTFFRIRRGKPPLRRDSCVGYGSVKPVACQAP